MCHSSHTIDCLRPPTSCSLYELQSSFASWDSHEETNLQRISFWWKNSPLERVIPCHSRVTGISLGSPKSTPSKTCQCKGSPKSTPSKTCQERGHQKAPLPKRVRNSETCHFRVGLVISFVFFCVFEIDWQLNVIQRFLAAGVAVWKQLGWPDIRSFKNWKGMAKDKDTPQDAKTLDKDRIALWWW